METHVTKEPCHPRKCRKRGHVLQDELEEPRWECFLGAQGQALPKGLEKQAERPQQRQP